MSGSSLGQRTFSAYENIPGNDLMKVKDNIQEENNHKNEENNENSKNNDKYSWQSMLAVVASLPPKQITKIDFLTNSSTVENNAVSWDDFYGYEEIKINIQRILRGIKKQKKYDFFKKDIIDTKNNQIQSNSSENTSGSTNDTNNKKTTAQHFVKSNKNSKTLKVSNNSVCGIVLYGPSGCGKTFLSKIIASEVQQRTFFIT